MKYNGDGICKVLNRFLGHLTLLVGDAYHSLF